MDVTIQALKEAGYPLSNQKDEAVVALAAKNVKAAYFPTDETFESEQSVDLLLALTYSMLLKRKIVATRFGGAEKTSQFTIAADRQQVREEIRGYCRQPLEAYLSGKDFECDDILEIYDKLFSI